MICSSSSRATKRDTRGSKGHIVMLSTAFSLTRKPLMYSTIVVVPSSTTTVPVTCTHRRACTVAEGYTEDRQKTKRCECVP